MAWVNLSGAFGYGTILTSTQMQNLRDNLPAIAGGAIFGLELSNDTDTDHDIAIATGFCVDFAQSDVFVLSSILTKQIDVDWVVGDNQGGFPSGLTLAGSGPTTYHVFLIQNPTSGVVDAGFDSSLTATNLLSDASGYTKYRRIGSIRIDDSDDILGFSQFEDEFLLDSPVVDVNVADQSTSAVTRALTVPTGIKVKAILNMGFSHSSTSAIYISPLDVTDLAPSADNTASPGSTMHAHAVFKSAGLRQIRTNTSGEVRSRASASSTTLRINTLGWIDSRGKND